MMNARDNFIAALNNQNPDWVPWAPLIDYANIPCFVDKSLVHSGQMDLADLGLYYQKELQCDIFIRLPIVAERYRTGSVTKTQEGEVTVTKMEINGKVLTQRVRSIVVGGMDTSAIAEYFIKDADDLLIYEELLDDSYLEYDMDTYLTYEKKIGNNGLVIPMVPRTPVMELIIELMGIENFTYAFMDDPEIVERVIQKMQQKNLRFVKMTLDSGLDFDYIINHEDQDILLTSPETYRKYIMPMMKEYCDLCHEVGKKFMMHACGHVREFLQMILDTGIDAHHYLSEAPVGNTPMSEARALWGDRINIMAALDPLLQAKGTAEDVEANLRSILNQLKGGNYLIMSALKPDIPEANIRIIGKVMKEWNGF